MAGTFVLARFPAARFEMDYNDNNRVTVLRCVNDGPGEVWGEVARAARDRVYSQSFPVGTTVLPVPTTVANRIQLTPVGPKFRGFSAHFGGSP